MSTEQLTSVNGLDLNYQVHGPDDGAPLLLIAGLGMQMTGWQPGFIDELVARGFRVVRFDNRDSGLSTFLNDAGVPDIAKLYSGETSGASYTLSDMADDAVGVLDAVGIEQAHIVGISMGGMIAQQLVIDHPQRALSLTSIMSTTGDRSVGGATDEATMALMTPVPLESEAALTKLVNDSRIIGSPGFPFDEDAVRARHVAAIQRANNPTGTARQFAAIIASPDRTRALHEVKVPTLVIHGADDPLVNASGGQATADAVPGSRLVLIDGMGHDLPAQLWSRIADEIATLLA